MAVGNQVGESVVAVGETVMELPAQVTAGVMSMNDNPEAEEQQAEAERQVMRVSPNPNLNPNPSPNPDLCTSMPGAYSVPTSQHASCLSTWIMTWVASSGGGRAPCAAPGRVGSGDR